MAEADTRKGQQCTVGEFENGCRVCRLPLDELIVAGTETGKDINSAQLQGSNMGAEGVDGRWTE